MNDEHITPHADPPPKDWPQPPQLDCDAYREELAGLKLSTEEENQVLAALWHIVCGLVDLGLGLDSASLVMPAMIQKTMDDDENELESLNKESAHIAQRTQQNGGANE
ncbi:MAG: hypothetical protein Tsb002_03510 [Wenzhouxiangellaceae bacterium]